ncbi:MAG: hypothetical protein V7609_2097 [Verrucomicrobiota bacterium]
MIISVRQIVIIGDRRIEKTATAQIDRSMTESINDALALPNTARSRQVKITETARALFDSLELPPS